MPAELYHKGPENKGPGLRQGLVRVTGVVRPDHSQPAGVHQGYHSGMLVETRSG